MKDAENNNEHDSNSKLTVGDYIALHLLNAIICSITIGVLYHSYYP